jgi:hypothetical protein
MHMVITCFYFLCLLRCVLYTHVVYVLWTLILPTVTKQKNTFRYEFSKLFYIIKEDDNLLVFQFPSVNSFSIFILQS